MKKTKFREIITLSGAHILMGKDENNNDELMEKFKGKPNTIIHTQSPGSPFGVIETPGSSKKEDIKTSGAAVARYSQDWRDNKGNIKINVFTGKDIYKTKNMKSGTWGLKKFKRKKIKKEDIMKVK